MTTQPVSKAELIDLAQKELAIRRLENEIQILEQSSGLNDLRYTRDRAAAEVKRIRDLFELREYEHVKANGKDAAGEFTKVRAVNSYEYDDAKMLEMLKSLEWTQFVVTTTTERLDKNPLKKKFKELDEKALEAIGVKYVEDYSVELTPLGELAF